MDRGKAPHGAEGKGEDKKPEVGSQGSVVCTRELFGKSDLIKFL